MEYTVSSVVVDVEVRGPRGRVRLRSLVDTGFYGDIITAACPSMIIDCH